MKRKGLILASFALSLLVPIRLTAVEQYAFQHDVAYIKDDGLIGLIDLKGTILIFA